MLYTIKKTFLWYWKSLSSKFLVFWKWYLEIRFLNLNLTVLHMLIYFFHQSLKSIVLIKFKIKFYICVILCWNMFGCLVWRLKVTKHFIFSSYFLAVVLARWLLQASEDMLAEQLVTLASTILLLQWTKILPTQGIYKEAPLADRLQIKNSCPFCYTKFFKKYSLFQEQTQNLRCWSLSVLTASKPLIYAWKKIDKHIGIKILRYIRILLNQEELIGHMNISPWTNTKLPGHRPVNPYCQKTFETNDRIEDHICICSNGNKLYEIFIRLFQNYFIVVKSIEHILRAQTCFWFIWNNIGYLYMKVDFWIF